MAARKTKTKKPVVVPQPTPWFAVTSSQVDDTVKIRITKFQSLEEATSKRRTPMVVVQGESLRDTVLGFIPKV
jgi:hypothetical protein